MDSGLLKSISKLGSITKLAKTIGISSQAISQWNVIPVKWWSEIARVTGLPIYSLHPVLRDAEQVIRADERRVLADAGRLRPLGDESK